VDDEITPNNRSPEEIADIKAEEAEPVAESTKVKLEEIEDEDQPLHHPFAEPETFYNIRRSASPRYIDDGDELYGCGLATADFDDDDNDDDDLLDLNSAEPRVKQRSPSPSVLMPPPPPPLPEKTDAAEEEESQWGSLNQLVAFRETSVAVGEEYLKSQGIKLGKHRAAPELEIKDWEAREMYNQGIKDAKKIDVRGRRLKGAEQD
jgi:hypothetical protein